MITAEMSWDRHSQPQASKSIQVDVPTTRAAAGGPERRVRQPRRVATTWWSPGRPRPASRRVHLPGAPLDDPRIHAVGGQPDRDDRPRPLPGRQPPRARTTTCVVAVDAPAGLLSASSNEASVHDRADTTPPTVTFPSTGATAPVHDYAGFRWRLRLRRPPSGHLQLKLDGEPYPGGSQLDAGRLRIDWDTRRYTCRTGCTCSASSRGTGRATRTSAPCPCHGPEQALSVAFTSPSDGATVSGNVTLLRPGVADGQPHYTAPIANR